ncbi:MAG: 6-carboxytetrahydropterin synthase [Alphaproteobacteria bacterium]|jgi:6-pyruvoyl-tetrahydropterin synthase|nr:6-carboxytetrahydropterin synthase [Alphaproteobacteria bacterium]
MYCVQIRDHVMIAHSLKGDAFGPAQNLHGATYVVDVGFLREALDENDIVLDIGLATEHVRRILQDINYRNLDDHPTFAGRRTTTEVLARWIFDRVAAALGDGDLGPSGRAVSRLRVVLHESHVALASYEADLVHG